MLTLCYHNGALGHSVTALIDCCTIEGGLQPYPTFVKNNHLHHYVPSKGIYKVEHPTVNMLEERSLGNKVISSTSFSKFGRMLIIDMGLNKWIGQVPTSKNLILKEVSPDLSIGEKIEILSVSLLDKITNDADWFVDSDHQIDILWFWENPSNIDKFLIECGLTPVTERVIEFSNLVADTNQKYYNFVKQCCNIANDIADGKKYDIDVDFYQTACIHMLLLDKFQIQFDKALLLNKIPVSTHSFIEIFKEKI